MRRALKGADRTTPETTVAVRKSAPHAKEDLTIHLTEFSSKLDDKSIPYGQSMVGQAG